LIVDGDVTLVEDDPHPDSQIEKEVRKVPHAIRLRRVCTGILETARLALMRSRNLSQEAGQLTRSRIGRESARIEDARAAQPGRHGAQVQF
jgi:hypothetical protein